MNKSLAQQLQALANEAKIHTGTTAKPVTWTSPEDIAFVTTALPKEVEVFANINTSDQARRWLIEKSEAFLAQPAYDPKAVVELPFGPEYCWRTAVRRVVERTRKELAYQLLLAEVKA